MVVCFTGRTPGSGQCVLFKSKQPNTFLQGKYESRDWETAWSGRLGLEYGGEREARILGIFLKVLRVQLNIFHFHSWGDKNDRHYNIDSGN